MALLDLQAMELSNYGGGHGHGGWHGGWDHGGFNHGGFHSRVSVLCGDSVLSVTTCN
ncbi:MAG TPA: SapB/AmfS family lanthipeptide [Pilimelia sp.]|nr:SapB/AmfS family lanthipeptide [Pilimelia sp.]